MSRTPPHPVPPPIDKGWAWVVVTAIFFERFFTVGVTVSSGLFLLRLVDLYNVSTAYAGMALTFGLSIFALGAPAATVIGEDLTPRRVLIFGGLFSAGSMAVAGFVGNLTAIIVMLGLAIGVVNSCSYGNGMVMIGKYFRVKRQMATNIALSGASIGQFVLPFVIQYLIETFGLGGAILISGALYLHCAVAGALLRPIDVSYQRVEGGHENRDVPFADYEDEDQEIVVENDDNCSADVPGITKQDKARFYKKLKSIESNDLKIIEEQEDVKLQANSLDERETSSGSHTQTAFVIPEIFIQNDNDELFPLPPTDDWNNALYGGNRVNSRLTLESSRRRLEDGGKPLSLKNGRRESVSSADNFYSNSTSSSLSASQADLYYKEIADDNSVSGEGDRSRRFSVYSTQSQESSKTMSNKCRAFLHLVFDFAVLKNRATSLFIVVTFLFFVAWCNFVLLLPVIVVDKGISGFDQPFLIAMVGIGDLVARAIAAGSLHCNILVFVQRYKINATAAFIGGVNLVLFIPASSFSQLAVLSFLHGLCGGLFECLRLGVLTDFVGVTMMAQTLGVVILFQGLGGALGQPLLGYLKDFTGSYVIVSAICSGSWLFVCILLLLYPAVRGKA